MTLKLQVWIYLSVSLFFFFLASVSVAEGEAVVYMRDGEGHPAVVMKVKPRVPKKQNR